MKKLSILIAMILCVTIGGVYAAWTYANPAQDITDKRFEQLITISTATEEGAAGEYEIQTNITGLSIEQRGSNDQGEDFHKAVLTFKTEGDAAPYVRFKLTLKQNTGSDIFDTLKSYYSVNILDVSSEYDNKTIFVDHNTEEKTEITWTPGSEIDTYFYELDLSSEISLNDFVLSSKAEHTLFSNALGRPVLEIKLSDGVLPTDSTDPQA